jgi:hypothetical protein
MKIRNAHSYIVFLLASLFLIPCTAKAFTRRYWGGLSPSEKQTKNYSSWGMVTCGKGTSGPFSVSYIGTPSKGYLEVVVDDVVETRYTNQYAYCKATGRDGSSTETEFRYYFDIAEGIGDITIVAARAYPGLMGTCDFDDKWEHSQWTDSSGKRYYFHETTEYNAKLPDCSETAQNGILYDFKGWSKGYEAGDVLSTTTTCQNLAANGITVNTATGVLPGLTINGSDTTKIEGSHSGTLSFYSNSVSLGDLDLDRTDSATNWSEDQLFMYNGNSSLITNKGSQLKALIEQKGETIYAIKPEYAYYLTPDALKEIRYYNDAAGYELNYNNLKNYGANAIACSTTSCSDSIYDSEGEPKVIFQHYGSKFLAGEVAQSIKINNFSYGAIKTGNDKICVIGAGSLDSMTNMIENQKCRWIDYVQTGNSYTDPATGETPAAFRLAFK